MCSTKSSAGLAAILTALSFLMVLVACSDGAGNSIQPPPTSTPTSAPTPTPTSAPTPTPTSAPTREPAYDVDFEKEKLAEAKDKWVAKGTANYNLEVAPLCLCPESSKTLMIVVRNGAIELVIDLYSGEALTEDEVVYAYTTINDLFSEINSALRTRAYRLSARYHPTLGYPTSWGVSWQNIVDDGYSLESIKYEPVDPSEPSDLLYDVDLAKEELSSAKDEWYANGSDNYDLRIRPLCECPEDSKDLTIAVRNGVIESVIDEESGETLSEEHVSDYSYRTIDDLFEHLEHALSSNPPRYLSVIYHMSLGHPFYLKVIYQYGVDGAADDGFTLERVYHKPVEPSLPATTPEASTLPVDLGKRDVSAMDLFSDRPGNSAASSIGPAATVEEVLEKGLRLATPSAATGMASPGPRHSGRRVINEQLFDEVQGVNSPGHHRRDNRWGPSRWARPISPAHQ